MPICGAFVDFLVSATQGGIAGGIIGHQASGAAIDKTPVGSQLDKVDSALKKKPKPQTSAAGAVGTTGDALGARLPRINK